MALIADEQGATPQRANGAKNRHCAWVGTGEFQRCSITIFPSASQPTRNHAISGGLRHLSGAAHPVPAVHDRWSQRGLLMCS
jgi:hypothetical protein